MDWLGKLACPVCHGPLVAHKMEEAITLGCGPCRTVYPYLNGVAYMIPTDIYNDPNYKLEMSRYNEIAIKGPSNYHGLDNTRPVTRAALLREFLRNNGVERFVDIGSGFGYLEEATLDLEVFAVDMSINLLQVILSWCPSVHCVNAIAEMLPFPSGSVDCLVCESTFQSVVDRRKFLGEIGRIASPGSLLVLSIAYQWHYPRKDQDGFNVLLTDERFELTKTIQELGFDTETRYLDVSSAKWKKLMDGASYLYVIGRKNA